MGREDKKEKGYGKGEKVLGEEEEGEKIGRKGRMKKGRRNRERGIE